MYMQLFWDSKCGSIYTVETNCVNGPGALWAHNSISIGQEGYRAEIRLCAGAAVRSESMALTIALTALKGGVGKSTIALNVASCLHHAGHRAMVVDSDPQATCRMWATQAAEAGHEGPPVIGMDGRSLRRDLDRISAGFAAVVIDTPSRLAVETRAAMLAADIVLLPIVPGGADVWALQETLTVLEEARSLRPELHAAVVVNRADRTTLARLTRTALDGFDVPVLKTYLGRRVAFGEATLAGQSVLDYAPQSPATDEIKRLTQELLNHCNGARNGSRQSHQKNPQKRRRTKRQDADTRIFAAKGP